MPRRKPCIFVDPAARCSDDDSEGGSVESDDVPDEDDAKFIKDSDSDPEPEPPRVRGVAKPRSYELLDDDYDLIGENLGLMCPYANKQKRDNKGRTRVHKAVPQKHRGDIPSLELQQEEEELPEPTVMVQEPVVPEPVVQERGSETNDPRPGFLADSFYDGIVDEDFEAHGSWSQRPPAGWFSPPHGGFFDGYQCSPAPPSKVKPSPRPAASRAAHAPPAPAKVPPGIFLRSDGTTYYRDWNGRVEERGHI